MRATVLISILLALLGAGCQARVDVAGVTGPRVGEIVLASEVDPETKEPQQEASDFPVDVEVIHATLEVWNLEQGEVFTARWSKGDQELISYDLTLPRDVDHTWLDFTLQPNRSLPAGDDYRVEVFQGERLISTATFSLR